MIAADTSTWIAFFQGQEGPDVDLLAGALADRQLVMPPPVLTELLSDPKLASSAAAALAKVPLIELDDGYWYEAGMLRARVLARKRKARLGDALIAQCCLHAGVSLITRDRDFRAFNEAAMLDVLVS
jgi:predicted nucleic acid-binding protein